MDRFIGGKKIFFYGDLKYLKSNMDRFIENIAAGGKWLAPI